MSDFTSISESRRIADKPVNESLVDDLIENTEYNFERALRCGTHATGVRLVLARGTKAFSESSAAADFEFSISVTFATDAEDGDPNFLTATAPIVLLSVEEVTGAFDAWTNTIHPKSVYMDAGSPTYTGFSCTVQFENPGSDDLSGILHWVAFQVPSSGE